MRLKYVLAALMVQICRSYAFPQDLTTLESRSDSCDFESYSIAAASKLLGAYNHTDGLWVEDGVNLWWNSANCIWDLAELIITFPSESSTYDPIISNTFVAAQQYLLSNPKVSGNGGRAQTVRLAQPGVTPGGFNNTFNDDNLWWALAWINAYDATGNDMYLQASGLIFDVVQLWWDNSTCNGGVWWTQERSYKNAITNELFLLTAVLLADRDASKKDFYLDWAHKEWDWFKKSGMINSDNLVNDGLNQNCENNGQNAWTYNQGVILGGLVELAALDSQNAEEYEQYANKIATAGIKANSQNGILTEKCEIGGGACNGAQQFKGIFFRYLVKLQEAYPNDTYREFIIKNAQSIQDNDNAGGVFGVHWSGPSNSTMQATSQSSALIAFIGAYNVDGCRSAAKSSSSAESSYISTSSASSTDGVKSSSSFSSSNSTTATLSSSAISASTSSANHSTTSKNLVSTIDVTDTRKTGTRTASTSVVTLYHSHLQTQGTTIVSTIYSTEGGTTKSEETAADFNKESSESFSSLNNVKYVVSERPPPSLAIVTVTVTQITPVTQAVTATSTVRKTAYSTVTAYVT